MATRFLTAGVLLLAWAWYRGQKMPTRLQWRNAAIVGTLMLGGGMGCTAYAEQFVASGLVVAFIAVTPALIALASLSFGIKPSRLEVFGIAIGLAGVLCLVRGSGFAASPAGLMAVLISTVSWSIGSVLSQHRFPLAGASAGFASEMICGGVVLMAISWLMGESFHWPAQPLALAAWVYLVVFGSFIAFSAYMILLSHTSAALATSYSFVNPVIAMLLGIAFAGETVTGYEWLAVGVIVLGVVMLVLGRKK
jgi:drug/metabolite transporter (DMT)-like permease